MKARLCRKDDIAVVYRACKALDKGIVMLEAYSIAVDPSRINKFIFLRLGIYLIDIESVGYTVL